MSQDALREVLALAAASIMNAETPEAEAAALDWAVTEVCKVRFDDAEVNRVLNRAITVVGDLGGELYQHRWRQNVAWGLIGLLVGLLSGWFYG